MALERRGCPVVMKWRLDRVSASYPAKAGAAGRAAGGTPAAGASLLATPMASSMALVASRHDEPVKPVVLIDTAPSEETVISMQGEHLRRHDERVIPPAPSVKIRVRRPGRFANSFANRCPVGGPRVAGPALAYPMNPAVPEVGLEPTRHCWQRILSPPRLPFRHSGSRARQRPRSLRIPDSRRQPPSRRPRPWPERRPPPPPPPPPPPLPPVSTPPPRPGAASRAGGRYNWPAGRIPRCSVPSC